MSPQNKESNHMDVTEELQDDQQPLQTADQTTDDADQQTQEEESDGLEFFANETETRLIALYKPASRAIAINETLIRERLDELGYDEEHYPLYPDRIDDLIKGVQQRRHFEMEIGGPLDAEISVHLSLDQTLASVQITPPLGRGLPASKEMLIKALTNNRVRHGIDIKLIDKLFAKGPTFNSQDTCCYIVAHGKKAVDGQDAEMMPLVEEISERRPKVLKDNNDQVDFKELGDFPVYEAGTSLFHITEPVEGQNGMTVVGKTIKAYQGKDKKVKLDKSVQEDPEQPRHYSSTVKGMPVFTDQGVHIENVLKLDEVSLKTGNVRFDGSIQIKQGVDQGMLIEASGDVKVGGLVENSTIISGGNVEIGGGVLGKKSPESSAKEPTKDNAVIRAKGDVTARFIKDSWVFSGGTISAQRQILQCRLHADNSIKMPAMGQLIGGHVTAGKYIEAGQLGVPAAVATVLEVGPLDDVRAEMAEVQDKIKQGFEQTKQIKALIHRLREENRRISPEKKEQILKARDTVMKAMADLENRRQELEDEAQTRKKAKVKALKKAFSECNVIIANTPYNVKEGFGKTTFYLDAGEVKIR